MRKIKTCSMAVASQSTLELRCRLCDTIIHIHIHMSSSPIQVPAVKTISIYVIRRLANTFAEHERVFYIECTRNDSNFLFNCRTSHITHAQLVWLVMMASYPSWRRSMQTSNACRWNENQTTRKRVNRARRRRQFSQCACIGSALAFGRV